MKQTTPREITDKIRTWTGRISKGNLSFIDVKPEYISGFCFLACADKVEREKDASIVHGWVIWESSFLLEAEHRSVVRLADGTFVDVTKPFDNEKRILFLEDESLTCSLLGQDLMAYKNLIYPSRSKKQERRRYCSQRITGAIDTKLRIHDENSKMFLSQIIEQIRL